MAALTYEELLKEKCMENSKMQQIIQEGPLIDFSRKLENWELLAHTVEMEATDIENIKSLQGMENQRIGMLKCWKQRRGPKATYEELTRALIRFGRLNLAEILTALAARESSSDDQSTVAVVTTDQCTPRHGSAEASVTPLASCGEISPDSAIRPISTSFVIASSVQPPSQDIKDTVRDLDNDFCTLLIQIAMLLRENDVEVSTLLPKFLFLPESLSRQHEADPMYEATQQMVLKSATILEFFKNLTKLKNWNFMMPDTLYQIVKDIDVEGISTKVQNYCGKVTAFKTSTMLKDVIGISFAVPDYCIRLTMKVEGWKDKTIEEAERAACSTLRRHEISSGHQVRVGYERVKGGCIELTFILLEPIKVAPEIALDPDLKHDGITSISLDGDVLYTSEHLELKNTDTRDVHPALTQWKNEDSTKLDSEFDSSDGISVDPFPDRHHDSEASAAGLSTTHPHPDSETLAASGDRLIKENKRAASLASFTDSISDETYLKQEATDRSSGGKSWDNVCTSMTRANERNIGSLFVGLLCELLTALTGSSKVNIQNVKNYLLEICPTLPKGDLSDMFKSTVSHKCWDYENYILLGLFIDRFIPGKKYLLTKYEHDFCGYIVARKLIEHVHTKRYEDTKLTESASTMKTMSTTDYQILRVKLCMYRDIDELALEYVNELWTELREKFDKMIPPLSVVIDSIIAE